MTELEPSTPEITAKTFDEVSMERSMSFVKALQELKNLRPQLYSAAEYCEKSYLHSDQKQMVLDNVKDYAVRALVNAVDHLGTVAYKLADLLEQQTSDVSGMELKVSCLDQKILTCCTYMNNEGLRQQQLLALIPRHHKHYILPSSVSKKVHFSPRVKSDPKQNYFQARAHDQSLGDPALKTISWHIGSENKSTLKGAQAQEVAIRTQEPKNPGKTNGNFHLLDYEESIQTKSSQMFGTMHRDPLRSSKPLRAFKSFDNQEKGHLVRVPVRSRSLLSSFFAKQKPSKRKAG